MVPTERLELHDFRHSHLKAACLPIPPRRHCWGYPLSHCYRGTSFSDAGAGGNAAGGTALLAGTTGAV